jgi:hypothetical protein
MSSPLASRIFRLSDQLSFAKLSSDFNPIHLDRNFARRTQMGAVVVHGIHSLAWAANTALQTFPIKVANIRARFLQPLYLDETACIHIRQRSEDQIRIELTAAESVIASMRLSSSPSGMTVKTVTAARPATPPLSEPADPDPEELASCSGTIALADIRPGPAFPALIDAIGPHAAKALLATSRIVGMECPGLHSLFTGLDINVDPDAAPDDALSYAVAKLDPRFRSLQIDITGSGLTGRLEAFARPAPPSQCGMAEISSRLSGRPFAGQRSIIVGGSRGLGEVTAKIIAAGGGHPLITYMESAREAELVATEIKAAGGACDVLSYDATSPAGEQLEGLGTVDCGYYFATPKIFGRKSKLYEPERLRTFLEFYATGFFSTCSALRATASGKIPVFYPSTIAIEHGPNTTAEYAMAKAAGEVLAGYMNDFMPHIHVVCRRLPRILTDQTATVGVASCASALDTMLPIVHDVQQMAHSLANGPP